jgi:hypothetical protein
MISILTHLLSRAQKQNDQAHPPPEAERGTNEAVSGRVQRLVLPLLRYFMSIEPFVIYGEYLR